MNENPSGLKKFILVPSYSEMGIEWIVVYTYTAHIPVYWKICDTKVVRRFRIGEQVDVDKMDFL